jgi:vesicle transport protein SEC22
VPVVSALSANHPLQSESQLLDIKNKVKQITRRLNRNSATEASIEADQFNIQ